MIQKRAKVYFKCLKPQIKFEIGNGGTLSELKSQLNCIFIAREILLQRWLVLSYHCEYITLKDSNKESTIYFDLMHLTTDTYARSMFTIIDVYKDKRSIKLYAKCSPSKGNSFNRCCHQFKRYVV